jgi:hypothetical protein
LHGRPHTGYSTLFLDDGGQGFGSGGTVNLTYRAALDYRAKLDDAMAARPEYTPGGEFTTLDDRATALISQAEGSSDPSLRGALGQRALDALAQAFEVLLREDGRLRERAHPGWWGATIDQTTRSRSVVGSLADLVDHRSGAAYARIVFDPGWTPSHYDAIIRESRKQGVTVVGQILDSSGMRKLSVAAWRHRVRSYVNHFPAISAWEIGNEVNGEWLGSDVPEKLAYAASYVKRRDPGDITMLTFYWQMGTAGTAGASLFQWIHDHVSARLADAVDVVALSTWIGDAPLGISMDEVFGRLRALFPSQRIAMGELGYWSPGTTKAWWWRSTRNPTTTVRTALARQMYLASRAFAGSVGGVFWWYYVQEMSRKTPLWRAVHRVYRSTS